MVRRTPALLCLASLLWTSCAKTPPHRREQEQEGDPTPDARINATMPDAGERPDGSAIVPPRPDGGPPGSCGSITADGVCAGSTLKYCQNNVVVNQECTQTGSSCQCTSGFCECVSVSQPVYDSCAGVPSGGTCWNGYLEYCDLFGQLVTVDCWSSGYYCDCDFFSCDCFW